MKVGIFLFLITASVFAGSLDEQRYCGTPPRNAKGEIIRRQDVLVAFQKLHPCPSTGLKTGACHGWAKDHVIPLACGGCDEVSNLQWLPEPLKLSPNGKDGFELKIYSGPVAGTVCKLPTIP